MLTAAHQCPSRLHSGGAAVAVRRGNGVTDLTESCVPKDFRHRVMIVHADVVQPGGIYVLSVWPFDSEGLSERNLHLLEVIATVIGCIDGPWVAAGDWNLTPDALAKSSFLSVIAGVVFATELGTCNGSVYDYFVVSKQLAPKVRGVTRLQDAGCSPHWPTRLILDGSATRFLVQKVAKPSLVPAVLPRGPWPPPVGFHNLEATPSAIDPDESMRRWLREVRNGAATLSGDQFTKHDAVVRWTHGNGKKARPFAVHSPASLSWRTLASRASEMANIMARIAAPICATPTPKQRPKPAANSEEPFGKCTNKRLTHGLAPSNSPARRAAYRGLPPWPRVLGPRPPPSSWLP